MKKSKEQLYNEQGEKLYFTLPCPFCSSTKLNIQYYVDRFNKLLYYVHCEECNCEGGKGRETAGYSGSFWNDPAVQRAVDKWNTRGKKAKSDDYILL